MISAVDQGNNINYVTSPASPTAMYAPQGGPQNVIFGKTGTFSGISEIRAYNNRLQVTGIEANSSAGTPLNLSYNYVSGNNGNIATQINNATNGRTQNYTYDPLNRLLTAQTQATTGGDCWGQSFGNNGPPPTLAADALANLFYTSVTQCTAPQPRFTMNSSNNDQFIGTGIGYDSDGDMTTELANPSTIYTYTYDAENRISTVSGMAGGPYCYTYDVFGVRVMKSHASGGSCSGTVTVDMLYWRNIASNTIAETDASGNTSNPSYNEYIFFAGRRIAQLNPSSGDVYYYFVDHLGSTRVVTTASGTACYEVDYLPYGAENGPSGFSNTCSTRYRFTGYERDLETAGGTSAGNDYAFARYYNSRLGRFMSRDPLGGHIDDPQTLNGYAYVRDNPLNYIDPTGLDGGCTDSAASALSSLLGFGGFCLGNGGGADRGEVWLSGSCDGLAGGCGGGSSKDQTGTFRWCVEQYRSDGERNWKKLQELCGGLPGEPGKSVNSPTLTRRYLPPNAQKCSAILQFNAPPGFNLSAIVAAGKAGAYSPSAALSAVGQFGTFDFQRSRDSSGNTTFYSGYTAASNVAVGAYLYGAGFSRVEAGLISNTYALVKSSNAGDPNQATFRTLGYDLSTAGWNPSCTIP